MNKEALEKEATKHALEWGDKTDGTYACCRGGYLAGAEPREKRIAELEEQIKQLKKENDELRAKYLQATGEGTSWAHLKSLEKENAELKEISVMQSDFAMQLDKAKELMKKLIANAPDTYSGTNIELQQKKMFSFQDAVNKARQFLKDSEVEKMTDEEMAKEWAKEHEGEYISDLMNFEEAFLAGLKAGRPKWHYPSKGECPEGE